MENEKMRIQVEFHKERVEDLKRIMKESQLDTYKALIDNALTLFEWSIEQIKSGRSIASVDEETGSFREVTLPAFSAVKPSRAKREQSAVYLQAMFEVDRALEGVKAAGTIITEEEIRTALEEDEETAKRAWSLFDATVDAGRDTLVSQVVLDEGSAGSVWTALEDAAHVLSTDGEAAKNVWNIIGSSKVLKDKHIQK